MESNALMSLVNHGESESVDFKLELHLDTAEQKAEFVKDIISLANSADELGYLIIGVDKNSNYIGINSLEEERIQQIVHTYIYPNVIVKCFKVVVNKLLVGVVEVQGVERPHRVIKSIDRLSMNEVFVRHGSTISKASPDEMFRMREKQTELQREVQQLLQAGERHLKIGNTEQAIKSYSKAIEVFPSVDSLLARAKAYRMNYELSMEDYLDLDIGRLAFKDLSDAFLLSSSDEIESNLRLERIGLLSICPIEEETWNDDISWAFSKLVGVELGKILLYAVRRMNFWSIATNEGWDSAKAMDLLERAVDLGYRDSQVYYFMAEVHNWDKNYGLALESINDAIETNGVKGKLLRDYLNLRIEIQIKTRDYQKALIDLKKLQEVDPKGSSFYVWDNLNFLEEDIYYRVCLSKRHEKNSDVGVFQSILRLLVLKSGLPTRFINSDGTAHKIFGGTKVDKRYPDIAGDLKKIVGDEYWQAAKKGYGYSVKISTVKPDFEVDTDF